MINLAVDSGLEVKVDAERPKAWTMPRPTLGIVLWKHQDQPANAGQCYGIVTHVGTHTIDLMVFAPNSAGRPRNGVKHVSDPSLRIMATPNADGVWDFCPGETMLREALKDAAGIIAQQAELLARLKGERRRGRPEDGAETD